MGKKLKQVEVPDWAYNIIDEVEKSYDIQLGDVIWCIRPNGYRGVYSSRYNMITMHTGNTDKSELYLFILLHELCHCIMDTSKVYRNKTSDKAMADNKITRVSVHNVEFFTFAYQLYKKYGCVETAIKREYKPGCRTIQKLSAKDGVHYDLPDRARKRKSSRSPSEILFAMKDY